MDTKYTIIAGMCTLFLSSVLSAMGHPMTPDLSGGGGPSVQDFYESQVLATIQAEAAHAEGVRAEAAKAERIRELREAGGGYEEVAVRIAASGREIGHIRINQQGVAAYEGKELITFGERVPLPTGNGVKIATLLLPGISAPIEDLREIIGEDGKFITPEVSVILKDIS